MAFIRPTLTQLRSRAVAIVNEEFAEANVDASLRMTVLNVLTSVMAEMANEEMAYLDYIAKQATPYTASDEFLNAWGMVWDIKRKLASFATGTIIVSGTPGASVAFGTEWRCDDTKGIYLVTDGVTVPDSGSVAVSVKSKTVGLAANLPEGSKMSIVSPVAGLQSTAISETIIGGAAPEDEKAYKARLLLRIQNPPAGGSKTDWVQWTLEVPGVTRAWCYPLEMGGGTVGIRFMMDDNGTEDGIPSSEEVIRIKDYLESHARKPVTAKVFVNAPMKRVIGVVIKELVPDKPEIRAAIESEIKYLAWNEAEPGAIVYVSKVWGAINSAAGVESFMLAAPTSNVQMETGEIPYFNIRYGDENANS